MRSFLYSIFWITNIGSIVQTLIIVVSVWALLSGAYSFSELSLNVFIVEYATWLAWVINLMIAILGDFGQWILTLPVLLIASMKLVSGTIIGLWAYSVAKTMPIQTATS